jgi:hypothetical protein
MDIMANEEVYSTSQTESFVGSILVHVFILVTWGRVQDDAECEDGRSCTCGDWPWEMCATRNRQNILKETDGPDKEVTGFHQTDNEFEGSVQL